jgi:hypothetical protein
MATGSPAGVLAKSSSGWSPEGMWSSATVAKIEVPALTFPVNGATALVATIPVPPSPSGGHMGIPGFSVPVGSSRRAPDSDRRPAGSPATSGFGSKAVSRQS